MKVQCGHILFLVVVGLLSVLFAEGFPLSINEEGRQPVRMRRGVHFGTGGRARAFRDTKGDYYGGYRGGYLYRNGYGYRGGYNGGYRRYRNRFGELSG